MKKTALALMLAMLGVLGLFACAQAETTTTVMVYMCGTDLQSDCVADMQEMLAVDLPDCVNVVVQAGGANEWDDGRLTPGSINRFTVRGGDMDGLEVIGESNMGDEQTLQSFIEYCAGNYPADRYGLVLWDHGGGSTGGICYDETADNDYLSLVEVNNALYYTTQETVPGLHFDFVGCDACLMATYDMAALAQHYADYYIASEELEPGWGWYYTYWLSMLAQDPDMPTQKLLENIVDGYYDYCISQNPEEYCTLSVVNLNAFALVLERMEAFSGYMAEALKDGRMADVSRGRSQMYAFGSYYNHSSDMVDMEQFVTLFRSLAPNAADKLLAALERAVVYKRYNERMFDYASGLSVLLPKETRQEFDQYIADYEGNEYTPVYTDFVKGYMELVEGGSYQFTAQAPNKEEYEQVIGSALTGEVSLAGFLPGASYEPVGGSTEEESDATEAETAEEPEAEIETEAEPEPETQTEAEPEPEIETTAEETAEATEGGDVQGEINAYDAKNMYAYSLQLSEEDIANLSYVEGMLLAGIDDGTNSNMLIDLGYLQNAWVDWEKNTVYSTFDGSWPCINDQPVAMYDQVKTAKSRRSIIPVTVNDTECYLVVVFDGESKDGKVLGYSKGYDENGLPVRGVTKLVDGDQIVPRYTLYYDDENGEQQETTFTVDAITYEDALNVSYKTLLNDDDNETTYYYSFCLNDIYGGYQLSESIAFE